MLPWGGGDALEKLEFVPPRVEVRDFVARGFQLGFQVENLRVRSRRQTLILTSVGINPKRALKMVKSWMVMASCLCRAAADRTRTQRAARLCDQSPQLFWAGRRPSQGIPP
jgi:hypothetical protein